MNDSFKRIGKQLQAARKERGLRTADVARELRISADYLRWLESGDFDQLPRRRMYLAFRLWQVFELTGLTFQVGSGDRERPQRKWL